MPAGEFYGYPLPCCPNNFQWEKDNSQPHRCPVCNGKGIVPNGFYNSTGETWATTDASPEICRACNGSGVIWGQQYNLKNTRAKL